MKRVVLCSACRAAGKARFAIVGTDACPLHADLWVDPPEDVEADFLDRAEDLPADEWPEDLPEPVEDPPEPVEDVLEQPVEDDHGDDFAEWESELDEDQADDGVEDGRCDGCGGEP